MCIRDEPSVAPTTFDQIDAILPKRSHAVDPVSALNVEGGCREERKSGVEFLCSRQDHKGGGNY